MKKKRIVAIIVVIMLVLTLVPALALASPIGGTPTFYVKFAFQNALDRGPDEATITQYASIAMNYGARVALYNILWSPEFLSKNYDNEEYVERLYRTVLQRDPDPIGKADWIAALDSGVTREAVFDGFVYSPESLNLIEAYYLRV